uniref:Hydrolases of the alpha/beta superfamily n=1 Tax=mine drainage metagenome TaxID=410659 RepID=E6Q0U4_9ZZZZ
MTTTVIGTLAAPQGAGPHPAIILIGGSGGGDGMARLAPRFAALGYIAATLPYFRYEGLPGELVEIPVERVSLAIEALTARSDVDGTRIAIFGISKGGEFALLAASLYPQIRAVIAGVPSPFAWQGIRAGGGSPQSSWTVGGNPVPFVPYTWRMGASFAFAAGFLTKRPVDLRSGYDHAIRRHRDRIDSAFFALERICGPILFLSAGDDGIWNSQMQCEFAQAYLREHSHPYADRHLNFDEAGHLFLVASPEWPGLETRLGPFILRHGGNAAANQAAHERAWKEIEDFLSATLTNEAVF